MWNRLIRIFNKQNYIVCVKRNMLREATYRDWLDICLIAEYTQPKALSQLRKEMGTADSLALSRYKLKGAETL